VQGSLAARSSCLDRRPQTASFIRSSTLSKARDAYYRIYKNSADNLLKWRRHLSRDEQSRIADIVRKTRMADYCPRGLIDGEAAEPREFDNERSTG